MFTQSCAAMAWNKKEKEKERERARREEETKPGAPNSMTKTTRGKRACEKKNAEAQGNGGQTGKRQRRKKTALRVPIRHGAPCAPARHLMTHPGADTEWWCPNHGPKMGNPPRSHSSQGVGKTTRRVSETTPGHSRNKCEAANTKTGGKQKRLKEKHQTPPPPSVQETGSEARKRSRARVPRESQKRTEARNTPPTNRQKKKDARRKRWEQKQHSGQGAKQQPQRKQHQDGKEGVCV